jgi:hypothetical protein
MRRFATVLLAVTTATMAAGCGGLGEGVQDRSVPGAGQFTLLMGADALPEGHPPIDRPHRALPEGHPPVSGYGSGLPPGHPVCPAGRQMLEREADGQGSADDAAPRIISI